MPVGRRTIYSTAPVGGLRDSQEVYVEFTVSSEGSLDCYNVSGGRIETQKVRSLEVTTYLLFGRGLTYTGSASPG